MAGIYWLVGTFRLEKIAEKNLITLYDTLKAEKPACSNQ